MRNRSHSSGDLVADRRAAYAESLAAAGDFRAAAELMEQALERAPGWPAGWCLLGDYRAEAGDGAGAVAAWRELARLDAEGLFGAALKLAAHGAAPAVTATDTGFVGALFDDYAERFEAQLLLKLRYAVPQLLADLLLAECGRLGVSGFAHAIDLGCGTGLMGERLRRHASYLEGVDLAAGMIAKSRRKGIYDNLARAELTQFLRGHRGGADLVTAADVLNYCGELAPVFAAAAGALRGGGLLAVSLEAHAGPEPMILRPSLRFAHEREATQRALREGGFDILRFEQAALRLDRGEPVVG